MSILGFELRRLLPSLLSWAVVLALAIRILLPVLTGLFTSRVLLEAAGEMGDAVLSLLGTSVEDLSGELGAFALMNTLVLGAAAIFSQRLGLTMMTRDGLSGTTDFLLTKDYSRLEIYLYRLLTGLLVTGTLSYFYYVSSRIALAVALPGGYPQETFLKMILTVFWIQLTFLVLGLILGILFPRIHQYFLVSLGTVLILYLPAPAGGFLSPFSAFSNLGILARGTASGGPALFWLLATLVLAAGGAWLFCTRDIPPAV